MTRNIWVGIVVVIVLVAGGWWYLNQSSVSATSETTQFPTEQTMQQNGNNTQPVVNSQPSQPTQTNPVPSTTSGMKVYSSAQYGFTVQYANAMQVNPPCIENRGTDYLCSPDLAIAFHEAAPQGSWFGYGYVAVFASKDSQSVASCNAASPVGKTSTTTINGVQFTVNNEGDAAAGTEHSYTTYSTLKNGACYTIIDDEYSYVDETGKYATSKAQADLRAVVQSFRFN